MIDHLLLTLTNLAAIPSIVLAYNIGAYEKCLCLILACFFSIIYHASETRFYGPALFDLKMTNLLILLQLDRFFAHLAVLVVGNFEILSKQYPLIISVLSLLFFSEHIYYLQLSSINFRILRVISHCFWHIGAFYIAFIAIRDYNNHPNVMHQIISFTGFWIYLICTVVYWSVLSNYTSY